jgi:Transposase DDE domain
VDRMNAAVRSCDITCRTSGHLLRANRPGRRAFVSGKRKQNMIKTTIADGQGRWATGSARRRHPNLNRAPSRKVESHPGHARRGQAAGWKRTRAWSARRATRAGPSTPEAGEACLAAAWPPRPAPLQNRLAQGHLGAIDRHNRKQGLKRSVATEASGTPLATLPAPANHRDDGLLAVTLAALEVVGPLPAQPVVHLDAGYDYQPCRQVLTERGMVGQIATRGLPAPIQAGHRWVIERTHAWGNQYGKLRWCTERRRLVVQFWLALASAVMVCGRLVRRAWTHYRWDSRPRRRP